MDSIYHDVQQGTDEWFELRMGKFTCSVFADLFSTPSTLNYKKVIYRAAFERVTLERPESFSNPYMDRGNELEEDARHAYEIHTFNDVANGGFFEVDEWTGGSPDGLVGEDGQIQIKCPAYNTAIEYLMKDRFPTTYKKQVQGELYVTNREWCDFVSYSPHLKLFIIREYRDEGIIKEIKEKIEKAKEDVYKVIDKIK
jgi:putative phage-type endonuclease